jgi:hypothetical protein
MPTPRPDTPLTAFAVEKPGALRLHAVALKPFEDRLDPVDALEDDADALDGDRRAVAILPHQSLGRVRKLGQPREPEKAASPFDRVDQPEDRVEHLGIVGVLLEADELDVELVEAFIGLGKEFP